MTEETLRLLLDAERCSEYIQRNWPNAYHHDQSFANYWNSYVLVWQRRHMDVRFPSMEFIITYDVLEKNLVRVNQTRRVVTEILPRPIANKINKELTYN